MATPDSTPETVTIPLTKGHVTIVDMADADLSQYKWRAVETSHPYAMRQWRNGPNQRQSYEYLHRVIMSRILGRSLVKGEDVDHIDGNSLNNRRANLRVATRSQNMANSELQPNNTSGFKGVYWNDVTRRWTAHIMVNRQRHFLGYYDLPEDAAIAYNHAAKAEFGEFAVFNDIAGWENQEPTRHRRATESARLQRNNTSGYTGVSFQRRLGKWKATLKAQYLGLFDAPEEAHAARLAAIAKGDTSGV